MILEFIQNEGEIHEAFVVKKKTEGLRLQRFGDKLRVVVEIEETSKKFPQS